MMFSKHPRQVLFAVNLGGVQSQGVKTEGVAEASTGQQCDLLLAVDTRLRGVLCITTSSLTHPQDTYIYIHTHTHTHI